MLVSNDNDWHGVSERRNANISERSEEKKKMA